MLKNCIICGNRFKQNSGKQICCSKECSKINKKQYNLKYNITYSVKYYKENRKSFLTYRKKHKDDINKYNKNYYQENKEWYKEYSQLYYQENKEEIKEYTKTYQKTPKGKEVSKKSRDKRYRNLDFIPLNDWFKGSNAHHINEIYVIYIPKELHKSIYHSILKNINMNEINILAWSFLESNSY